MSKIALVDADLVVYKCGFAAEKRRYVATYGERSEVFDGLRDARAWMSNAECADTERSRLSRATAASAELSGLDTSPGATAVHPGRVSGVPNSLEYVPVVEPVENACQMARTSIDSIMASLQLGLSSAEFYLSGKDNFRKALATLKEYKGNRKDVPKPVHYDALRDFITHKYRANVVDGQEADDAIGIRATELGGMGLTPVIVSTDKDLKNIPGYHYNWVDKKLFHVTEREALSNFYCQLLSGDSTDNIPGIDGIGTTKARRILKGLTSEKSLWHAVLAEYTKHYPNGYMGRDTKQALVEIGRLLYIRRKPDEMWSPP